MPRRRQLAPRRRSGGVYANGALGLGTSGQVICESTLPRKAIDKVMDHTRGGRVASGGGRISVLATTVDGASRVRYLELAPDGPTWGTSPGEEQMAAVTPTTSGAACWRRAR